jgi:sugar phosphate isomerase/epimerase
MSEESLYEPWQIAIGTRAFACDWTAEACLKHLADRGHEAFELVLAPGFLWPADMDKAGRLHFRRFMLGHRLRLVSLALPGLDINVAAASGETSGASIGPLEQAVELAGDLGAEGIVVGPGKSDPLLDASRERPDGEMAAAIARLAARAKAAATGLWLANPSTGWLSGADELMQLVERAGEPALGIAWDLAAAHAGGHDAVAGVRRIASRLRLVRLGDAEAGRLRPGLAGAGTLPLADVPAALAVIGYAGPLLLDSIAPDSDRAVADSIAALTRLGFSCGPQAAGGG